jgi:flagellar hook-associated protein FlgK
VPSQAKVTNANRVAPFATVPAGLRDVAIYLDPGQSTANLQVMTRDGRHLLGTTQADGASFVSNANSVPAPYRPGSTYSADYLNQRGTAAYRDLSMFYGARAKPTEVQVLGTDHVPVSVQQRSARLQAELSIPTGNLTVPANSLVLNGVTLPITGGAVTRPEDVAAMLNTAIQSIGSSGTATAAQKSAVDGVVASVRDGTLELTRPVTSGPTGQQGLIELGFGPQGDTQLLARMGFRTAAYLDGAVPEDLLVFTTGSGDVKIAAAFSAKPLSLDEQRQQMRANPLQIKFTAADRYRIVDTNTDTVVAERAYTAGSAISYRGLQIGFSAAPKANDVFVVNGNQDGLGDNGNGLRFVDLEKKGITGPGNALSVGEAYLNVVDQITNVTQQAQVATKALEVMHQQAVESRESVSGVSLDEEAANLIRFQQAYQAAAKTMQIASQMFDAVLRI